jgi:hypothetical protein
MCIKSYRRISPVYDERSCKKLVEVQIELHGN